MSILWDSVLSDRSAEVFDLLPLGICVFDRDLTISFWNRTLADWTDIPANERFMARSASIISQGYSPPSSYLLCRFCVSGKTQSVENSDIRDYTQKRRSVPPRQPVSRRTISNF